jgi:hypothetical protein
MANSTNGTGPWVRLLEIAGATAGLAALIYVVGAVTMWVRLNSLDTLLQPDTALEHMSQRRLIALGLRGLFVVALFVALIALVTLAARRIREKQWWQRHKEPLCWSAVGFGMIVSPPLVAVLWEPPKVGRPAGAFLYWYGGTLLFLALFFGWRKLKAVVIQGLEDPWNDRFEDLIRYAEGAVGGLIAVSPLILLAIHYVNWQFAVIVGVLGPATGVSLADPCSDAVWTAAVIASIAILVVAATGTWVLFGIALALVVSLSTIRLIVESRTLDTGKRWLLVGGLTIGFALAGICWQVEGQVEGLQAVSVIAKPGKDLTSVDSAECLVYFGETDALIFVAEMTTADHPRTAGAPTRGKCRDKVPTGTILEIPRDEVQLQFLGEAPPLSVDVPTPWRKFADAVEKVVSESQ